jgi:hypothetical protein
MGTTVNLSKMRGL